MKTNEDLVDTATICEDHQKGQPASADAETSALPWHAEYITHLDEAIGIKEVSAESCSIITEKPLTPGLAVWIDLDGDLINCVVWKSEAMQGFHIAQLKVVHDDQRLQDREPCHEEALLEWRDSDNVLSLERFRAVVQNVSDHGIQVALSQPIPPQTPVHVAFGSWFCEGRTCYSKRRHLSHLIGIELTSRPVRIAESDLEALARRESDQECAAERANNAMPFALARPTKSSVRSTIPACSSGSTEPSPILTNSWRGVSLAWIAGFSLGGVLFLLLELVKG